VKGGLDRVLRCSRCSLCPAAAWGKLPEAQLGGCARGTLDTQLLGQRGRALLGLAARHGHRRSGRLQLR
jgi:hypothetical protein